MTDVDLADLLSTADKHVADELRAKPTIEDVGHDLDLDDLAIQARRWRKASDVVAVVADLKNSTQLSVGKHPASTASIYEASMHPAASILDEFDADDMDIQGDGIIGLFWGERRTERAICAAITLKTFTVKHLQERLDKKWPEVPATGFKIGVAASSVLVKRIGLPRTDHNEEVWAGKAVNYAAKAAQCGDQGDLLVTATVFDRIKTNDYLFFTCGCPSGTPSMSLWSATTITQLANDDPDREAQKLATQWCSKCGPTFCQAVLDGKRRREDTKDLRAAADPAAHSLAAKTAVDRQRKRDLGRLR